MPTLIFLCVANAARSQMAEGLARTRAPGDWKIMSAGSHPGKRVSTRAVAVMQEIGVDISHQQPKSINEVNPKESDLVITLCSDEVCPVLPKTVRRLHWPLRDPANAKGTEEEQLQAFRDVRDELDRKLGELWLADGMDG
jgi:arsenate reductase